MLRAPSRVFRPKYRIISDDLRQRIVGGDYAPGQTLPSQQQLMDQYGASLSTVRQSLSELAQAGLVRPEHGRGVFVEPLASENGAQADHAAAGVHMRAGFAMFTAPDNDAAYVCVLNAFSEALHAAGWEVSYAVIRPDDPQACDKHARYARDLKVVTVIGDIRPAELVSCVRPGTRMIVGGHVLNDEGLEQVNQVSVDAFSAGYYAAQMLLMQGHRRLAIINQTGTRYCTQVESGVDAACADAQLPRPWRDTMPPIDVEHESRALAQAVEQEKATGLVIIDDLRACRMIGWLRSHGIRVPQDVSVSMVGGLPRDGLAVHDISRVNIGYRQLGEALAKLTLAPSGPLVHTMLPVRPELGGTIAPPRDS